MSARLLAIGLATPRTTIDQASAARTAATLSGAEGRSVRSLGALYRRSGVERRAAVVVDDAGAPWFFGDPGAPPSTGQRAALYRQCAAPLAEAASRQALARAQTSAARITHLVTVSCTGFDAPGVDCALIEGLGLSPDVARTNIGFMGCHAALNALRLASSIVRADDASVVLVCCVELCSLHFQHDATAEGQAVANALFADGAGAAVIAGADAEPSTGGAPPIRILASPSRIFPDSSAAMSWTIGDHGFEMTLSARVPELLERHVPDWVDGLLAEHALSRTDVGGWAIHPGGPRIVAALRGALGLEHERCTHSTSVLASHGNMSSPTILFILDRLAQADVPRPWLALAFGPGLAGEAALLG